MIQHFCDVPQEALCGEYLAANNFKKFYQQTTNSFAHVTCPECRNKIRETRLAPNGFPDPHQWGTPRQIAGGLVALLGWDLESYDYALRTENLSEEVLDELEKILKQPPVENEPPHIEERSRWGLTGLATERARRKKEK